jgi:hypothetical protein
LNRAYYKNTCLGFCETHPDQILGEMTRRHGFDLNESQRDAWIEQTNLLQSILKGYHGNIYFEFAIPRMGKRIDVLLVIDAVIFILEFKVGSKTYPQGDIDQVTDYALDLRNFHEESHNAWIVPILVSTSAKASDNQVSEVPADRLFKTTRTNAAGLSKLLEKFLAAIDDASLDINVWENSSYKPTPTIIEATLALYAGHSVEEISRSDAGAQNLSVTSKTVSDIVEGSKRRHEKSIVFVTGVPGAGKTLVGLNIASSHMNVNDELYSVFLSGNGPLVSILQEALARDRKAKGNPDGSAVKIGVARSEVKAFIQNIHHFRDEGLADEGPPNEHIALFDEAQRVWDKTQTVAFMKQRKNQPNFDQSESDFLISCMDRHEDWAVIVCLVGGGQEINKGEAGIIGWVDALKSSYPDWKLYASDQLLDSEYGGGTTVAKLKKMPNTVFFPALHLKTSMRSFRSEAVALLVKQVLDLELTSAQQTLKAVEKKYPIMLTRDLDRARSWLKDQARGSERYGVVVSSQAERLKPLGINVKVVAEPVHWFLDRKDDVRSSYYLEEVATEFQVQGLELDWVCVTWDADFRYSATGWENWSFRGNKWQKIRKDERKIYQKNAYRVLLTRARQGMVVVVPEGNDEDKTRPRSYYDGTYQYLRDLGLQVLD